jgi:bifunctional DNA-binding transcriptional regulator/antitoxin component of YhaV-PrlF toxin-antitoxin module
MGVLPIKWAKSNNLEKGSVVEIKTNENSLIIEPANQKNKKGQETNSESARM